ncbi:hypothetical protein QBC44DRAFT_327556 [Cladorrhinum sp. PSN332]|nr:hypothetical protein QBC44DRAFT_327556 [Cladorrhinum sp. PSN332]
MFAVLIVMFALQNCWLVCLPVIFAPSTLNPVTPLVELAVSSHQEVAAQRERYLVSFHGIHMFIPAAKATTQLLSGFRQFCDTQS